MSVIVFIIECIAAIWLGVLISRHMPFGAAWAAIGCYLVVIATVVLQVGEYV